MVTIVVSFIGGMVTIGLIWATVEFNQSRHNLEYDVAAAAEEEEDACHCNCDIGFTDLLLFLETGTGISEKCLGCDKLLLMVSLRRDRNYYKEELDEMKKREHRAIQRGKHVLSSLGFAFFDGVKENDNES